MVEPAFPASDAAADAGPPPAVLTALEAPRALAEYAGFAAVAGLLGVRQNGGGRPVVVLPGLLAGDGSTRALRRLLRLAGYAPYGWGLGTNVGPTKRIVGGMDDVLGEITDRHGRPVSIIGWSLGGMFGYDLAGRHRGAVDRLITLGSPLYLADPRQSRGSRFYDGYAPAHLADYSLDSWRKPAGLAVPATSIFSKTDGIVRWQTCVHPPGPLAENIEVYGSHCGLGFHPAAAYAILDRLAAPGDPWHKFVAPAWLAIHFPAQHIRTPDNRVNAIA